MNGWQEVHLGDGKRRGRGWEDNEGREDEQIVSLTSNGNSVSGYFSLKCWGTNELHASFNVGRDLNNYNKYLLITCTYSITYSTVITLVVSSPRYGSSTVVLTVTCILSIEHHNSETVITDCTDSRTKVITVLYMFNVYNVHVHYTCTMYMMLSEM